MTFKNKMLVTYLAILELARFIFSIAGFLVFAGSRDGLQVIHAPNLKPPF